MPLAPTLWRTCRVLANPLRLACLRAVIDQPGSTVEQVARQANVALPVASLYLRHLQARGLIRPERVSRWVRYTAAADEAVAHAGPVLAAIGPALLQSRRPYAALLQILTAFTHPRRLAILRAMPEAETVSFAALRRDTGISVPALCRHLKKLERHGMIAAAPEGWRHADLLPRLAQVLRAETLQR